MNIRYTFTIAVFIGILFPPVAMASGFSASNLAALTGENKADAAGSVVAGVGDLNGDGFEDAIVAATQHGSQTEGAVYIVYGRSKKYTQSSLGDGSDNVVRLLGEHERDQIGETVAGIGDVNGDGFDDAAVGTHYF